MEVTQIATDEAEAGFYAERDGKRYRPDKPNELFIMYKDDPATPGTDDGWVYGIVAPDGKEVISCGSIQACVDCHRQARHDRVFGEKPKVAPSSLSKLRPEKQGGARGDGEP